MDTSTAISTLSSLKSTIDSNVSGLQAQSDAIATAIAQLQGTLDTESADIAEAVQAAAVQAEPLVDQASPAV